MLLTTGIWRRFLRLLPLAACLLISQAQGGQFRPDSSLVQVRVPSPEAVDSLRKDRDFSYLRTAAADDSWWTRFWVWLGRLLTRSLSDGGSIDWGLLFTRVVTWTLALAALVLVVMKLLGVDTDSLLRKRSVSPAVTVGEAGEHIDPVDFDRHLEAALGQRDLRRAIRLYYLEVLRQLSASGIIQWHPDKTNGQYFREIPDREIQARFGRLTRIFEYIWYGDVTPRDQDLEAVQAEFAALKKTMQ